MAHVALVLDAARCTLNVRDIAPWTETSRPNIARQRRTIMTFVTISGCISRSFPHEMMLDFSNNATARRSQTMQQRDEVVNNRLWWVSTHVASDTHSLSACFSPRGATARQMFLTGFRSQTSSISRLAWGLRTTGAGSLAIRS